LPPAHASWLLSVSHPLYLTVELFAEAVSGWHNRMPSTQLLIVSLNSDWASRIALMVALTSSWPLRRPTSLLGGLWLYISWHSLDPATHYGRHPTLLGWHLLQPLTLVVFLAGSYEGPHFSQQTFPCLVLFTNQKQTIQQPNNSIQSHFWHQMSLVSDWTQGSDWWLNLLDTYCF
jgi:hypothetical protein